MSNSRSQLDRDEESEDGNAVETEESVEKETEEEDLCSLEDFSPLWPSESMGQEQATELSPEAAMECLEQLKESGEITEDFTIHLKAKYTLLYQAHITQQEKEQEALLRAKQSMAQLEHLRGQLQDSECIPDDPMTERGHLRQVLLDHYNELAKTSQRHEHLLYTLESLRDEKQLVEKEYKKLPKPTEREKQNLVLSEGCEVLKSEVAQRKEEVCILHEELKAQYDEQHKLDLQLEEQQQMENQLKERLATLILQPLQIQNDLELLNIKLKTLKGHQSKLMEQEHTVQAELQQAITLQRIVEQERAQISGEIDQQCTLLMHLGQNRLSLTHKTESATEKCAALQADRAALELQLDQLQREQQNQRALLAQEKHRKVQHLRLISKTKLQLHSAKDRLDESRRHHDKALHEFEACPKDAAQMLAVMKNQRKEGNLLRNELQRKMNLSVAEQTSLKRCMDEENSLACESYRLRAQLAATVRVSKKHMHGRDAKAQDCLKAKQMYQKMKDEMEIKTICFKNLEKNLVPLQKSVAEFSMTYDIMKNERNVLKDCVQTASQQCTERREKTEILKNELEVLEVSCNDTRRKLNQAKKRQHELLITHDGLRTKLFIMKMHLGDLQERHERQKQHLMCLSTASNRAESELPKLRKVYAAAVSQRDKINQMLIQRDQEMSSLAEHVTLQQDLVRRADIELLSLDEKQHLLTLSRVEKCRQLHRLHALRPAYWSMRSQVALLQIELARCQDHRRMLEQRAENPEATGRARLLPGCDPTHQQLTKMVQQLERQLVGKEEKVLQVCVSIKQLDEHIAEARGHVENTRNEKITLGQKVNVLKAKIGVQRRRMEALVSELAMRQGEALHLEQEVREKEEVLEQSTRRFNEGLEPWPGLEHLWLNKLKQHEEREIKQALKEEQDMSEASGGVASKAEVRPTAYLPLVGREGYVPHPYGAQAPFKPYPPCAAMRRFRKPKSRPIEI